MEGRLFDVACNLDPESRVAGRRYRDSPQARGLRQRTADSRAVERLYIEARLGQQRRAVASGGIQGSANGLHPGAQRGSHGLILVAVAATLITQTGPSE